MVLGTLCFSVPENMGSGIHENYYWREYFGLIPEDAVVAGRNLNGNSVYVGQGYIPDFGVIPGVLHNCGRTINVGSHWRNHVTTHIKVLCGFQENFYWMEADAGNLHVLLVDKHPVIGGYQADGPRGVGRVSMGGDIIVGKVDMQTVGNSAFYYTDGGKEYELKSYEILMYKHFDIDPR